MGIFPDVQRQLTLQSKVGSGPTSNSFKLKWLFLLSARMNKIISKMKEHVQLDGIWPKFKLIQAFIVVLVTCKNEVDPFKNEGTRWSQHFPIISLRGRNANSAVSDWI